MATRPLLDAARPQCPGAAPREAVVVQDRLRRRGEALEERGVESEREWTIMAVNPDHRAVAVIAVIVPAILRRQHETPRLHDEFLARGGPVAARPRDDEAQGAETVPVRFGGLAR